MKKRVKHCIESCRFIHLFLCFVLVSGECSAFALFRTVVKLIMLHYSCFARKNVQLQALFCRLQNVFIIIRKKVIQHLRRTNKNGSPCIVGGEGVKGLRFNFFRKRLTVKTCHTPVRTSDDIE